MRELFVFCTSKTNFLFDVVVYDKVDGCAMGSPLAPILANLFLGHHENIWLDGYEGEGEGVGRYFIAGMLTIFLLSLKIGTKPYVFWNILIVNTLILNSQWRKM